MFTGVIEHTARVVGIADGPKFLRLTIARPANWTDLKDGESIAVNGCCLTVAEREPAGEIGFDVVAETLSKTNLGLLKPGEKVHVERSLRVGDRIDGHFVQGHVDGVGTLLEQQAEGHDWRLRVGVPKDVEKYLTPKGSIAIDGVSLTIAKVDGCEFEVALIPTTLRLTTLGDRAVGWPFNLEADVLSKTVISWLERERR